MAHSTIKIEEDPLFQQNIANAGDKLVVVDFFATWCGPCLAIAPFFEELPSKYPNAVFLKVDVDKCKATVDTYKVRAMPTFISMKNGVKLDTVQGAKKDDIIAMIEKHYVAGEDQTSSGVQGHMDLSSFFSKSGCICLNQSDDTDLDNCLRFGDGTYLESDCDEQLLITLEFNQTVKIHSMKLYGPSEKGAKTVKLFINQPHTMDFDQAERNNPVQLLNLTEDDVKEDSIIPLKFVKLQSVNNLTIFIKDNLGGEETTIIEYLGIIGSPVSTTKMDEFKRVAGKKGESH
ncbi:thioredoxin-like protein 1 [Antedon mediterranea]|uniref:thioredoxin-like protein 1 n=1 Tax=Antedon mediterranea TaxID=105859 RepID=UPI003AF45F33